jgi:hypothetical protein
VNSINVPRKLVQEILLADIKQDLTDPEVIAEVEKRVRVALRRRQPKADHGKRIAELQMEVANLTDAIAVGLLRSSPALAKRLQASEMDLERLQAAQRVTGPSLVAPDIRGRYLGDGRTGWKRSSYGPGERTGRAARYSRRAHQTRAAQVGALLVGRVFPWNYRTDTIRPSSY